MRPVRQKQPRIKSTKITQSAEGEACTLRIEGVCNHNPETVVFAHINGGGMGYKHHDIHGCYACSECHTWFDGGYVQHYANMTGEDIDNPLAKKLMEAASWPLTQSEMLRAMIETQNKLIEKGLIKI